MAENWTTFGLDNLIPDGVTEIVEAVTTVTGTLNELLTLTKATLEIVKTFASAASSNPVEEILRAAIDEIERFIDGLTQQTAAHAIMIPIQKRPFGIEAPDVDRGTPTADELLDEGDFNGTPGFDTISFVNETNAAVGGNAGFWGALSSSLDDQGDNNKPNFPPNFAVAGVCIVFGAEDYKDLQRNFTVFEQVFDMGNRANLSANTRPTAQNVRVRTLPLTQSSPARIGVQIDWATIPLVIGFPLYSTEVAVPTEIFVVRSTDNRFREQFAWSQAFSREPQNSQSDLQEEGANKVIARITNDGFVTRYIDDDESLVANQVYYYGICIRYSIDDEVQPMGNFSNIVRARFERPQGTRNSVQPDWWGTPSLIALFPGLEGLINTVRLEIARLGSRTTSNSGASAVIDQTLNQINLLIEQGQALLSAIDDTANKLSALTQVELQAATSSTIITVNEGGMSRWMGDLATRLSDESDPTRPPFEDSDLVAGIVIVAGAPTLPNLQPFIDLLSLFFGSDEDNPILDAIAAVEVSTRDAETLVFGADMSPSRESDPVTNTPPRTVFDPTMIPVPTIACD